MTRPFHTFSLFVVFALSTSSTRSVLAAEEAVTSAPTPTTFVEKPSYSSPIIGTLAPDFALPDHTRKTWKLSEHTGQRAILVLLIAQRRRIAQGDSEDAIFEVVRKHAALLQTKVDVVLATQGFVPPQSVVTSAVSVPTTATASASEAGKAAPSASDALGILRDDGSLAKMYGVVPQRVVGVLIDRYGFLREVNYWPLSSGALDVALQNIVVEQPKIEIGKLAPDFALTDADGQLRKLSDLRGRRNVLLTFFPEGSSCGCGSQLPSVENDQTIFRKSDTDIWLLSSDDAEAQKELMETLRASSAFLPDVSKKVALLYGATTNVEEETAGMSVLIDKSGVIRSIDKVAGRLYGDITLTKMASLPK